MSRLVYPFRSFENRRCNASPLQAFPPGAACVQPRSTAVSGAGLRIHLAKNLLNPVPYPWRNEIWDELTSHRQDQRGK